jgi:hypothetical protein
MATWSRSREQHSGFIIAAATDDLSKATDIRTGKIVWSDALIAYALPDSKR